MNNNHHRKARIRKVFLFSKRFMISKTICIEIWRLYRFVVLYYFDCNTLIAFDSYPLSMRLLTFKFMNKIWTKCFMFVQWSFIGRVWNKLYSSVIRYSTSKNYCYLQQKQYLCKMMKKYYNKYSLFYNLYIGFYIGYPVVNDPLYNHEVFGPLKGRGGDIGGKTDEQLVRDLINIHNAENWLGIDGDSELSLFKTMKSDSDDGLGSLTGKGTIKIENKIYITTYHLSSQNIQLVFSPEFCVNFGI